MLSGLKFIPRDQIDRVEDESLDDSKRIGKSSRGRKKIDRGKKKKSARHSSSGSDDEDNLERISKGSRKKKKWYSSDEDSAYSTEKESDNDSEQNDKKRKSRTSEKKTRTDEEVSRREMGLEWMLRPKEEGERKSATITDNQPEEPPVEEIKKANPRELNPFLKDNGSGYPEDTDGKKAAGNHLMASSIVGDGGASWRLKALKRAQEQAAREGRNLDEVVEERWGSIGKMEVSVASRSAAPSHAHMHATRNRRRGLTEEQLVKEGRAPEKKFDRESRQDVSIQEPKMRVPKLHDSLSWGKRKGQNMSSKDAGIISSASSSLNKAPNDGSFIREIMKQQKDSPGASFDSSHTKCERKAELEVASSNVEKGIEDDTSNKLALSANQLAAKVMQLRMKGKHDEAEKLLEEVEQIKAKQDLGEESNRKQDAEMRRYAKHDLVLRQKNKEEDSDLYLANRIVGSKQYSLSGRADDEYDYEEGPRKKTKKKGANDHKPVEKSNFANRILTQQERCQFCFENPKRPRHLVVAIANFTYLMLPQWQPVVPGHCCILPMQHESATRMVDNNLWDEIRNFKKCLIMMFAKQEKDVVFLETVMGLAQQRRHCLVECIPLPQKIAKQAPLYFKKAIDEAEDEWSQHNAKKLIDTSVKGLRGSIPKDFPYFHVEFGLSNGFVHVIDDEKQFKSNFGLNVVRGMLRLPAEDMHRRQKHDSSETQRQAAASFAQDWDPFDWTKQLE